MSKTQHLVSRVSRYVQLTKHGNEYRGQCPSCKTFKLSVRLAYDNRAKQWNSHGPDSWRCFSCGAHEIYGSTLEGFMSLVRECKLTQGKFKLLPEPINRPWYEVVQPPQGSIPNMTTRWLGAPVKIEEECTAGRLMTYKATYTENRVMRWQFIRYSESDPGQWKVRRLPMRERYAVLFPGLAEEIAKQVQGRSRVTVAGLIAESGRQYRRHLAQAVGKALRALGLPQRQNSQKPRSWYYVCTIPLACTFREKGPESQIHTAGI